MTYVKGKSIRYLREKRGYTQKKLAEVLCLSDKTVSKWETCRGLPDNTLLVPLARALGVSVGELLRGELTENKNRAAHMGRGNFYVCPLCGNVIFGAGNAEISCCGIHLPPMEGEPVDKEHGVTVEIIENEYYITMEHPMTKEHFISFFAFTGGDRVHIVKLYSEQDAEVRFPRIGRGKLYAYCNRHGLYELCCL